VKWVVSPEEASAEQPVGMGIEFQYSSDDERRATEEVVEGLMSRELGEALSSRLLKKRPH
jgi:type IV pilus assembly protein PilZ